LIPPFSVEATDPADVYPLHGIIPEAEWKILPANVLESAQTYRERILLLPYRKSDWINDHLESSAGLESKRRKKALYVSLVKWGTVHLTSIFYSKILLYISAMLAFRQAGLKNSLNKEKLYEQLSTVPGIVVDSLLSRFAEMPRDSSK
jgi:DNA-directed RNA polymerase I subunit RPA49